MRPIGRRTQKERQKRQRGQHIIDMKVRNRLARELGLPTDNVRKKKMPPPKPTGRTKPVGEAKPPKAPRVRRELAPAFDLAAFDKNPPWEMM